MPATCAVKGCKSRKTKNSKEIGFFSIPTIHSSERSNKISRIRREAWIKALGRTDYTEKMYKHARVCSRHFVSGRSSKLDDINSADWVPTLNLKFDKSNRKSKKKVVKPKESSTGNDINTLDMDRWITEGNSPFSGDVKMPYEYCSIETYNPKDVQDEVTIKYVHRKDDMKLEILDNSIISNDLNQNAKVEYLENSLISSEENMEISGRNCVVTGCHNCERKTLKLENLEYHTFPRDKTFYNKWLKFAKRKNAEGPSWICSYHFKEDDFVRDLKKELMQGIQKKKLKYDAVPTIYQPVEPKVLTQEEENEAQIQARKKYVDSLLKEHNKKSKKTETPPSLAEIQERKKIVEDLLNEHSYKSNKSETTTIVSRTDDDDEENENEDNEENDDEEEEEEEDCNEDDNITKSNYNDVEQILKDLLADDTCQSDNDDARDAIFEVLSNDQQSDRSQSPVTTINDDDDDEQETHGNLSPTNSNKENLYKENVHLKEKVSSLNKIITNLNNEINILKYKNDNLTRSVGILHEANQRKEKELKKYRTGFSNTFTQNQIDFMINKVDKEHDVDEEEEFNWLSSEIFKGITLKYLGHNNYSYLQKQLKYPLPPIRTIKKWVYDLNLKEGILREMLKFLNLAGKFKTDKERCTILMHGEMQTKHLYEYYKVSDEIIGPHNYMQVIIARGLFSSWQQPIFIGFDVNITKTLLNEIIDKLLEINYNTVAIVSNFIGNNITLWNELNLSPENNSFFHHKKLEKIYVFSDTIHLLRLLRNSFIDYGAIIENSRFLTKEPLKKIFGSNSEKLATTTSEQKCSVGEEIGFAIELFSHATASKLRQIGGDGNNLADLCDIVNEWFNLMYSKKTEYGRNIDYQNLIIDKMYETIKSMRHTNQKFLQFYQRSILMSISSLKCLYEDLKKKYKISYILTSKLNLDPLESVFSEIRNDLVDDHPTPVGAIYKIRSIILGKQNPSEIDMNDNSREIFISAEILRKAKLETIDFPILDDSERILLQVPNIDDYKYLVHAIAYQYKDKYPNLVQEKVYIPSDTEMISDLDDIQPSFEATNWWLNLTDIMENQFESFHKNTFQRKFCTKQLIKLIQNKYLEIPHQLIEVFIKQRTFSLIKRSNENLAALRKRKLSSNDDSVRKKIHIL